MGCGIVHVANSLEEGLERARTSDFDLAVLDLNLGGTQSLPIANVLIERKRPFLVMTGYGAAGLPERLNHSPVLTKPFDIRSLENASRHRLEALFAPIQLQELKGF